MNILACFATLEVVFSAFWFLPDYVKNKQSQKVGKINLLQVENKKYFHLEKALAQKNS